MVQLSSGSGTSPVEQLGTTSEPGRGTPFVLSGDDVSFAPRYHPETFRRTKQRNVNRKDNFCGGENVSDQGAKNWEFHVVGRVLNSELRFADKVAEKGKEFLLTSLGWSGEILVLEGEIEGPVAWDPQHDQWQWQYTLDLVSTGRDEGGTDQANGIISEGIFQGGVGD